MIPFALVHGELCFYNLQRLEIQIHELSAKHIITRLPSGYTEINGLPESVVIYFYNEDMKKYEKAVISSEHFSVKKTAGDKYSDSFEIRIGDLDFSKYSRMVSTKYLEYIDLKLYAEDSVMSHVMTGGRYPENMENSYSSDPDEMILKWTDSPDEETKYFFKDKKFYYSLEAPSKLNAFLQNGKEAFPYELRKKLVFDGIVTGNSFCTNLFPDFEQFRLLSDKAASCGLKIMVSVPPVSESETDKFCRLLKKMIGYLHLAGTEECVFQFGDPGMLYYMNESFPDDKICSFEKGILLHKSKRDPRRRYLADSDKVLENEAENLMFSDNTVFGPFFQTNTGTFCPLHALIVNGSRGRQTRVSKCEKYCEKYYLRYPDHLFLKGEGNSLFGFCSAFLNDKEVTESAEWKTCKRAVINI